MTVGFILVGTNLKTGYLCATLGLNSFTFTLLLREDAGHCQTAEFQRCFHPEKILATGNERTSERQRNVSRFNKLNDLILIATVLQLHLILEIEGGFGVVVDAQLHLLTDLTCHIHLNVLVEIESGIGLLILRQSWIVDF